MALKNFNTFPLLEEYLNYLTVIKGRSPNTVVEYRTDILMFFSYRIAKAQAGNRRNKSKKNCIHPAILEISQTKAKVIENNVSEELETPENFKTNAEAQLETVIHLPNKYRFLVSGNYLIFYTIDASSVKIVRILYGKRDYVKVLFSNSERTV